MSEINQAIGRFLDQAPSISVLVVGDCMLDRYLSGQVNRLSPEAPVPVVLLRGTRYCPGGAANVAASVAALGCRASL